MRFYGIDLSWRSSATSLYFNASLFLLVMFLSGRVASGANHYVRDGASGNGSGSDWTNACDDFTGACATSSLVRGDTYYVASGFYQGRTFNRAESGTSTITIKGATLTDHGTDTGWSNLYSVEATQATWTDALTFTTRYWVFDGTHSPATPLDAAASNPDNYGFTVRSAQGCSASPRVVIETVGDNQFKHVSVRNTCPNGSNCMHAWRLGFSTNQRSNFVFSHTYAENNQTDLQGSNVGGLTNPLIEYHYSKGQYSHPNCHGEVTAFSGTNAVFRYNYFDQCRGTGCIASNGGDMIGFKIYGNVMNDVAGDDGDVGCGGGNGAIAGAGSADFINTEIYNNTIIQPGMCFGWFYDNNGSGNIAYNNIIKGNCIWNANGTHDYNYYVSCNSGQNAPSEANRQTGSNLPFVSSTNFNLKVDTNTWKFLSAPYNHDASGVTRTSSRGALQFIGGAPPTPPLPPQGLQVTVN